jgi:putative DNA primase/helicase
MERELSTPKDSQTQEPLQVHFDRIPERLREYPHFVVWQYELVVEELKKPPFDPKTGTRASVRRPDTWGSFQQAQTAYMTGKFAGIGIVLTSDMGIIGIDIDHLFLIMQKYPSKNDNRNTDHSPKKC